MCPISIDPPIENPRVPVSAPLRFDVSDLLRAHGFRRAVRVSVPLEGLGASAATVAPDDPLDLDLVFERVNDGIVVRGTIDGRWRGQCSNGLEDLVVGFSLPVGELFEPHPVDGETYPLQGHEIDLEQLVRDVVLVELPLAPSCGPVEDCPDADEHRWDDDAGSGDPRWSALSELEL